MKLVRYCLFAACLVSLFCIALVAQTQSRRPEHARVQLAQSKLVNVEGHKISYKVAGSGSPTVVLEYGLGGSSGDWETVFPASLALNPQNTNAVEKLKELESKK